MSYWISIEPQHPTPDLEINLTYNVSGMLRRAGLHPNVVNGMKVNEAYPIVSNVVAVMEDNPDYFRKYNPENGWGSYEHTLEALVKIGTALYEANDDDILRWQ